MKQPLCDWMAAANGFAIYSAHMIPWPRSGMVSLPIKRRLPRKRRAVGHNPRIITALRLLYHRYHGNKRAIFVFFFEILFNCESSQMVNFSAKKAAAPDESLIRGGRSKLSCTASVLIFHCGNQTKLIFSCKDTALRRRAYR